MTDPETKIETEEDADPNALRTPKEPGKSLAQQMTEISLSTVVRNASVARTFADDMFGSGGQPSDINDAVGVVGRQCAAVRAGEIDGLTDTLTAQIATLDALFTDSVKRAAANMSTYPEAFDRYMNIAMRAQAGSRTTAETIARMKRGGAQTVKVVHVHEGGQAVVADTINQGQQGGVSGGENGQPHEQPGHAPLAALSGPDEARNGVPLSSLAGADALSLARRKVARRAQGQ